MIHFPLKTMFQKNIEYEKTHTPTNTVKKNWYTYMCQDLHLHSLYTINILYHTPQTTQIYFLHAPACTCIHLKHPRPSYCSFSELGKSSNSMVLIPQWLHLFGCRGAEQRPVSYLRIFLLPSVSVKKQCSNSCDPTSHKLLTMCCYFLGLALAEIFTKTRDEHLP